MSEQTETMEQARERQERERQERHEREQAKQRATFDQLEAAIAPLRFNEHDAGIHGNEDPYWGYTRREILGPDSDEVLGRIRYQRQGYYSSSPLVFELTSKRIKNKRRGWRSEGTRRYKKFDSAVAAIKKFCIPTSGDEERAKVLREELRYYEGKVSKSERKHIHLDHDPERGWYHGTGPRMDVIVSLLASDIRVNQMEGEAHIRKLVRQKRVHLRYKQWVTETFIEPRQQELNALDLSKEHIR